MRRVGRSLCEALHYQTSFRWTVTTTPPTVSDESAIDGLAQPADYEALLCRLAPFQQDVLHEAIAELRREREALDAVAAKFDATLKSIQSVRDEIRELVRVSEQQSIDRRDELLNALNASKGVSGPPRSNTP